MIVGRLKIGQKVWIMSEFPTEEIIIDIDIKNNEVWLSDGNPYNPKDIYSSKARCIKAN